MIITKLTKILLFIFLSLYQNAISQSIKYTMQIGSLKFNGDIDSVYIYSEKSLDGYDVVKLDSSRMPSQKLYFNMDNLLTKRKSYHKSNNTASIVHYFYNKDNNLALTLTFYGLNADVMDNDSNSDLWREEDIYYLENPFDTLALSSNKKKFINMEYSYNPRTDLLRPSNGVSITRYRYDYKNRIMIVNKDSYPQATYKFDRGNRIVETKYYKYSNGELEQVIKRNRFLNGNIIEEKTIASNGVTVVNKSYDKKNRILTMTHINPRNEVTVIATSYENDIITKTKYFKGKVVDKFETIVNEEFENNILIISKKSRGSEFIVNKDLEGNIVKEYMKHENTIVSLKEYRIFYKNR